MIKRLIERMTPSTPPSSDQPGYRIDPSILRAYDIRGIVGQDFNAIDAYHIGRAFATDLPRSEGDKTQIKGPIALAHDGRLSSPMIEQALAQGLLHSGCDVLHCGLGPSPMLYYTVYNRLCAGGIVVTASHNPSEYNGMKCMLSRRFLLGDDIQRLGQIAANGLYRNGRGHSRSFDAITAYHDMLIGHWPQQPLNTVWDPGNGATGDIVRRLVSAAPGNHKVIHGTIDGHFPNHHPDPSVPANLVDLQKAISSSDYHLGIALDGDGDRVGFIDHQGDIVATEHVLMILARDILTTAPGSTIILDAKAGPTLRRFITDLGADLIVCKSGHSLIKATMAKHGAVFAGEMSAHIFFGPPFYGYDDGIYAALRLMQILVRQGRSLREICQELPTIYRLPEIQLECSEDDKFSLVEHIRQTLPQRLSDQGLGARHKMTIDSTDGIGITGDGFWLLLRASNTQSIITLSCEASNVDKLADLHRKLGTSLASYDFTLPPYSYD